MIGLCVARTITVRGMFGDTTVSGWQLGAWAVHRQVDNQSLWAVTLLSSGLSLPFVWASFASRRSAIAAMADIVRINNAWHDATQSEFNADLRRRLVTICRRHGAVDGGLQLGQRLDRPRFATGASMTNPINEAAISCRE